MIKLYTKPDCYKCNMIKKILDTKKVVYETVDISANENEFEYLSEQGVMSLPVVGVDDNELITDYNQILNMFK